MIDIYGVHMTPHEIKLYLHINLLKLKIVQNRFIID